jgi:hypothetical protein
VAESVDEEAYPHVYIPHPQAAVATYGMPRTLSVAVRTGIEPTSLAPAVRAAVGEFDRNLPLYRVATMKAQIAASTSGTRITADLLAVFAVVALVLAALGIYSVMSYSVAGRTREIGVRVALGAERVNITGMARRSRSRRPGASSGCGRAGA